MKRVAVVGSSGAGKTTLSLRLGEITGLEVHHLDALHWKPGWTEPPKDEWHAVVRDLAAKDSWIIDGNFGATQHLVFPRADTIVLLAFPRHVCIWNVLKRQARHIGRCRPDMGPGCPEKLDPGFLRWIWDYPTNSLPRVLERIEQLAGDAEVIVLRNRKEVRRFLRNVGGKQKETTMSNQWQEFFDGHAPVYMENCFVTNTLAEVDFLIEELGIKPGDSVLDVGCGAGRHSVELAKRGYRMTGVDLSEGMLAEARRAAAEAGVEIEFVQANAAEFKASKKYDAAICLCEGAFCLLGAGDDPIERDLTILRNISDSLKPGAKLLMTMLNGYRMARKHSNDDVARGEFDPLALTEKTDAPVAEGFDLRERGYIPTEITLLCRCAGLEVQHIWGGTAGNWGRRPIDLDEMEIMVVARKP